MEWTLVYKPKSGDGHRLFKDEEGRISVCDNSGSTPSETDDGPLYIEPGAEAKASVRSDPDNGGVYFTVPVRRGDEGRHGTHGLVDLNRECVEALAKMVTLKVTLSEGFPRFFASLDALHELFDEVDSKYAAKPEDLAPRKFGFVMKKSISVDVEANSVEEARAKALSDEAHGRNVASWRFADPEIEEIHEAEVPTEAHNRPRGG